MAQPLLGALAALGSSFTWAYASARYTTSSRTVGSVRVNLVRALVAAPIYVVVASLLHGRAATAPMTGASVGWLATSVLCSYGFADILFFSSARSLGISTALAIASVYPLWSALAGALLGGEPFGVARLVGVLLCIGGIVALVRLQSRTLEKSEGSALVGLIFALLTSLLWAGNTYTVKRGSVGLDVWQANAVRYTVAILVLLPNALLQRSKIPWSTAPTGGWLRLGPPILADCILGSVLFVYGLSNADLSVAATLSSLAPLVSVPVAIALGAERWSLARALAIAVTVGGALLLVGAG